MTILAPYTASRVRNAALSALHFIAYEHQCEVPDILALITPSQPEPSHPSAAQTDGEDVASQPSSPSVAPAEPEAEAVVSFPALQGHTGKPAAPSGPAALPPSPSRPVTNRQRVRDCHEAHPDWTAAQIAAELGMGTQQVRVVANHISLKLPKAAPAKPQDGLEPPQQPEAQPEPKQPPAAKPDLPLPPPAIKVMHSAKGRFYLRERIDVTGSPRFVHQSLAPCPTGPGPLMTSDRKWAWYDTMERFKGAVKKWPELADMRKEAASHA